MDAEPEAEPEAGPEAEPAAGPAVEHAAEHAAEPAMEPELAAAPLGPGQGGEVAVNVAVARRLSLGVRPGAARFDSLAMSAGWVWGLGWTDRSRWEFGECVEPWCDGMMGVGDGRW